MDRKTIEGDVLYAQAEPLHQPQSRAIEQRRDEPDHAIELIEQRDDFVARSYERLAGLTAQQRFDELGALVAQGIGFPTNVDHVEFLEWLSDATRARLIRNRYIHGNWEYVPIRRESDP